MSSLISALDNAVDNSGIAKIQEIGLQGMITLRGDLSDKALNKAVAGIAGVEVPKQGQGQHNGHSGICWMSPDELLILCPYEKSDEAVAHLSKALEKAHALAVNVSDARACFRVSGLYAREVMAKLAPVDLSVAGFKVGMFRRTRLAQVAAAFWMVDEETFQIVCFRSNAQYMFDLLKVAAQVGSEVKVFQ